MRPEPNFYLGERGEGRYSDYDGRLRTCYLRGEVRPPGHDRSRPLRWLSVEVHPPLPLADGGETSTVALRERWAGNALDHLGDRSVSVIVFRIVDDSTLETGTVDMGGLQAMAFGDVARLPELLPPTVEQRFDKSFAKLEEFVRKNGHADVPPDAKPDRYPLGVWVANIRHSQSIGELRPDWQARLESLPGWRWLAGDDFFLAAAYAAREGHTDVPLDYNEDGRPLGSFVAEVRRANKRGVLAREDCSRLEAIPVWHW